MSPNEEIRAVSLPELKIVRYPDPRLRQECAPVEDPADPAIAALVERMFELMFAHRGVGLAAPQVGLGVRIFIASPEFEATDRHVYVNPRIMAVEDFQEGDEGCLSFPGIYCKVKRHNKVVVSAFDALGRPFQEAVQEFHARIVEHEVDHLDGRLLVDRMGSLAKLANRKALKELEEEFAGA